jgi:hypothetical protein
MGHAGAIISGGTGTAKEKYKAMEAAGIRTVQSPAEIGHMMADALKRKSGAKKAAVKPAKKAANIKSKPAKKKKR